MYTVWITVGPDIYVHRLWITVGPNIYCTPSVDYSKAGHLLYTFVDYSTAGRLFTPSVDYSRAGHVLYIICGLQYGRTFIVHCLWFTVGPDIYCTPFVDYSRPDVYCTPSVDYSRTGHLFTPLSIKVGPDIYVRRLDYSKTGYLLYHVCGLQ